MVSTQPQQLAKYHQSNKPKTRHPNKRDPRACASRATLTHAHLGNSPGGKSAISDEQRLNYLCARGPLMPPINGSGEPKMMRFCSIEEVLAVLDVVQFQRPSFRDGGKVNRRIPHPERIVHILQNRARVEVHETLQMGEDSVRRTEAVYRGVWSALGASHVERVSRFAAHIRLMELVRSLEKQANHSMSQKNKTQ